MKKLMLGVDIGGSHITSAVIDIADKREIENSWVRNRISAQGTAQEIISAWAANMQSAIDNSRTRPTEIKIAMPGPMAYHKGICLIRDQNKFQALYGLDLKEMLASALDFEEQNITFFNDAACFLKGELYTGSLSGFDSAIGLTLGTGLGTSHTANGRASDSDLWNMPFNEGIAEDYISTRWFVKRFSELSGCRLNDVKDLVDNHSSSPFIDRIFSEFSVNLARFMYLFIQEKTPHAAVIGGNIANAEHYFLERTRTELEHLLGYSFPVTKSVLGEKAILFGACAST